VVRAAVLVCGLLVASLAGAEEIPGTQAVFAQRGAAIFWGILRGPDEARSRVVLRIERLDAGSPWRLASIEAVDPVTRRREWVRLALDLTTGTPVTVEMPHEGFLARPTRRVLFYVDVAALQGGRAGLVVSYANVPEPVPEFDSPAELEEHFRQARLRLSRGQP
jgi:hypothetical protein